MKLSILSVLLLFLGAINGYKILLLTPYKANSHWLFLQHIIKALLERHHEVTVITSNTWNGIKPDNYTEVLIDPPFDDEKVLPQSKIFEADDSFLPILLSFSKIVKESAHHALNHSNVQNFLHDDSQSFDLVINEEIFMDSFLMFAHKFKAPLMTICAYGYSDFFDRQFGLLTPWSHVPHTYLTYSDNMSFYERLHNTVLSLTSWVSRRSLSIPRQNAIAQKYFGHLGELPSIDDLTKNISVILINSHRSVLPPRPTMPGTVYIGGAHIKEPKPLPNDLQLFLDGAQDGAIYFSFGTYVKSNAMPPERLKIILNALKQLKQRVIWKYDDESIQNIPLFPSNVLVRKWLPQNDVLAHPNIVLFISHGGMFGHLESLYRGVPLLMIPFWADQFRNAKRAQQTGYAKQLNFRELSADLFVNTIQEMTTNKSYLNKAREISAVFKDNIVPPLDEAVWWIEHVAKFRGAKHLKSHAVNMSWFSYLLIDVFAVLILGFLSIIFWLYFTIKIFCGRKSSEQDQKPKQN